MLSLWSRSPATKPDVRPRRMWRQSCRHASKYRKPAWLYATQTFFFLCLSSAPAFILRTDSSFLSVHSPHSLLDTQTHTHFMYDILRSDMFWIKWEAANNNLESNWWKIRFFFFFNENWLLFTIRCVRTIQCKLGFALFVNSRWRNSKSSSKKKVRSRHPLKFTFERCVNPFAKNTHMISCLRKNRKDFFLSRANCSDLPSFSFGLRTFVYTKKIRLRERYSVKQMKSRKNNKK